MRADNEISPMTSAPMPQAAPGANRTGPTPLLLPHVWLRIVILAALFGAVHWEILYRLFRIARHDDNWSHALVVPLISIYFIIQRREQLSAAAAKTCWWGLPIFLLGLVGYFLAVSRFGHDMFRGYFMILELFGLVWWLTGTNVMRYLWFPIAYLVVAVKISDRIWQEFFAARLQVVAADSSTAVMNFFGADGLGLLDLRVLLHGTTIELVYKGQLIDPPLTVAEACSGLRMLMAFVALGIAVAFLVPRPWWSRIALVIMTVPIALFVNIGRVCVLALLSLHDPDMSTGEFHKMIGMIMLIPALGLFVLLGWILDRLVVEPSPPRSPTAET